jgi:hypothetical protein
LFAAELALIDLLAVDGDFLRCCDTDATILADGHENGEGDVFSDAMT